MRGVWNFLCDQISSGCLGHCHLFLPVFGNHLTTKSDPCTKDLRPLRWTLKESAAKQRSSQHSLDAKFCKSSWLNTKFLQSVCGNSCFNTIDCRLSLMHLNTSKWTSNLFKSIPCGRKPVFREYHIIYKLYICTYISNFPVKYLWLSVQNSAGLLHQRSCIILCICLSQKVAAENAWTLTLRRATQQKKSENAAKDVYVTGPLMAPLFSRIDVKGNDHLDFLKPFCMIGYHCHHQKPPSPLPCEWDTPQGPQRQGDALMDPGTLSRKISIFLHLGKHPTEESCGIEIWRKFPTKKRGKSPQTCILSPERCKKIDGLFMSLYQAWLPFHVSPGSGRS